MKVYSWNMLFKNAQQDRAFAFIKESDFDIFCLQEVSGAFLKRLQSLPCHLAYEIDVERLLPIREIIYSVILSRYPIQKQQRISFRDYWDAMPWRARFFTRAMRPFAFTRVTNRGALTVELLVPGASAPIRVFNLHLVLAHPTWRLEELEQALAERDTRVPTVVCGDFNILESSHITILNWFLGGRVSDALRYKRERLSIEKRFIAYELTNPLRGTSTHPLSQSQLDHILVSKQFSIKNAAVIPDRYGSDHHPICVETA